MKEEMGLGKWLSVACYTKYKEMGLSMEAIAAGANVSVPSVISALKDGSTTRKDTWVKICDTLGFDYDALVKKYRDMEKKAVVQAEATKESVGKETQAVEGGSEYIKLPTWPHVVVHAEPEDLYRLFLFCEERMADGLRMGTRMPPEELCKLMQAMYALRDASLALQPGEVVMPQEAEQDGKPA